MKCGLTIVRRPYGKKGKTRVEMAINWKHQWGAERSGHDFGIRDTDIVEVCDGEVHAVVSLDWGYSDVPSIEVAWKCDKCGFLHSHPELELVQYDLGKFIDRLIEIAGPEFLETLVAEDKARQLRRDEEMRVFLEQEAERRKLFAAKEEERRRQRNARRREAYRRAKERQ